MHVLPPPKHRLAGVAEPDLKGAADAKSSDQRRHLILLPKLMGALAIEEMLSCSCHGLVLHLSPEFRELDLVGTIIAQSALLKLTKYV